MTTPPCEHKFVLYQPFKGDAYYCCEKAGCGITLAEYEAEIANSKRCGDESMTDEFWWPWTMDTTIKKDKK